MTLTSDIVDDTSGLPPVRGDDLELRWEFAMPAGETAGFAWLTLKRNKTADDPGDAQLEITTSETADGQIEDVGSGGTAVLRFDFSGVDWTDIRPDATYYWDVQLRSVSGKLSTDGPGTVVFTRDVTLATTP